MSLSRLIVAIVWLSLSVVTYLARRRARARSAAAGRRGVRVGAFLLCLSVLYLLLGLLWLDLAL